MTEMRSRDGEPEADEPSVDCPTVSAHECSSDRTVFTEDGNSDGWIATDLTVSLRR